MENTYQVIVTGKNNYEPNYSSTGPVHNTFESACKFAWTWAQCHGFPAHVVESGYSEDKILSGNFIALATYVDTSPDGFVNEDDFTVPSI